MGSFRFLIISAALLMLGACGKVEPQAKEPSPPAQMASPPVPPVQAKPAPKTYEGPFGLAMGIQSKELVEDLGFKKEKGDNFFSGTPPKPVTGFEEYFVLATPAAGVCRIITTQEVKGVSGSGDQLKAAVDSIVESLEVKYGKPTKKFDFASQNVYKRNPELWMMALMKEEVTYSYYWVKGNSFDPPNEILGINVEAMSSSINDGYVRLAYSFSNEKACFEEVKRKKSSNL